MHEQSEPRRRLNSPALYIDAFANVGQKAIEVCAGVGRFSIFIGQALYCTIGKIYSKNTMQQLLDMLFFSLTLIFVTGFFSGAVLSLQSYNGLQRFGATNSVPAIVALSLARELGPVLTGLMITSRVGSRIGAEIGGMSITSQIVAMRFLGVDPMRFLIVPRILAAIIAMPVLSLYFTLAGSLGAYIVCTRLLFLDGVEVIRSALDVLDSWDVISGLIKATAFGFIISAVSSYLGYNTNNGAIGVGKTTTNSVVISSMLILLCNYILTSLMFR